MVITLAPRETSSNSDTAKSKGCYYPVSRWNTRTHTLVMVISSPPFLYFPVEERKDASLSTSFVVNDARHAIYIACVHEEEARP